LNLHLNLLSRKAHNQCPSADETRASRRRGTIYGHNSIIHTIIHTVYTHIIQRNPHPSPYFPRGRQPSSTTRMDPMHPTGQSGVGVGPGGRRGTAWSSSISSSTSGRAFLGTDPPPHVKEDSAPAASRNPVPSPFVTQGPPFAPPPPCVTKGSMLGGGGSQPCLVQPAAF